MDGATAQAVSCAGETEEERRDRVAAFIASDAFSDFVLERFAEAIRRAVAEQVRMGLIDPE